MSLMEGAPGENLNRARGGAADFHSSERRSSAMEQGERLKEIQRQIMDLRKSHEEGQQKREADIQKLESDIANGNQDKDVLTDPTKRELGILIGKKLNQQLEEMRALKPETDRKAAEAFTEKLQILEEEKEKIEWNIKTLGGKVSDYTIQ